MTIGDFMNKKFDRFELYALLQKIPYGKVITYGQAAALLGNRGWARAVGNALHRNPDGEKYPCYKVVHGDGSLCEAFVFGGVGEQQCRLENEGIEISEICIGSLKSP